MKKIYQKSFDKILICFHPCKLFQKEGGVNHKITGRSILSTIRLHLIIIFALLSLVSNAQVTVSGASFGTGISADKAANATSPLYTTLGDIQISETFPGDFPVTGGIETLILTAPAGWAFSLGQGSVSDGGSADFNSISSISVTANTITINLDITGTAVNDIITISGIQVQASNGAAIPSSGQMYNATGNAGTATFAGITSTSNTDGSGGTDFGDLSQTPGNVSKLAFVTQPGTATVGSPFGQQPAINTEDQFGTFTTNGLAASQNVTISLSSGTGTLSGTTTLNIGTGAGNGTVAYTDLQLNTGGVKILTASSPSLTDAVSNNFTVSQANSSVILSSDINPSCFPGNITLTATINPNLATGTIQFFDGAISLGTATVSGGVATIVISSLAVGSHSLTAVYSGDASYNPGTSPVLTQVVNPRAPATPGAITGSIAHCPGLTGRTYSITAVANATTYTWALPAGWTLTEDQEQHQLQ